MSRSILVRIPLSLCLSESEVAKRGKMELSFDLLGILPPARMAEILGKVLADQGWTSANGAWAKELPDKTRLTLDPAAHRLHIDVSGALGGQVIGLSVAEEALRGIALGNATSIDAQNIAVPSRLLQQGRAIAVAQIAAARDSLLKIAIQARQELNHTLKDVYREALLEKAKSLGTVASVSESSQGGTTRIRVEIR